ncbi:hypothetical protein PGT21_034778 [Puccinia graminis f. sp. tritici]|uniref:Uncharacterized protein n=1 Tax=Puccinia graminis f. sp. tritici TaxID=56615 RepID=A0A5B0NHP2_PUCGR|nr:hypothetical protein PGT21_034778 [Puccinia graminis f. sp. tritici]KAA1138286.1 hypothetical protein PGTUg99_029033 [Puccinia graminis f. sp. tritici]
MTISRPISHEYTAGAINEDAAGLWVVCEGLTGRNPQISARGPSRSYFRDEAPSQTVRVYCTAFEKTEPQPFDGVVH